MTEVFQLLISGLAPTRIEPTPRSDLKPYILKAGRMPSRKIPLLPKFGRPTQVPAEWNVSPSVESEIPDTPKAPRDYNTSTNDTALPPATNPTFPYTTQERVVMSANRRGPVTVPIKTTGAFWIEPAHIGDPCTISCLDHILSCGHKIITAYPEPCARNCHARSPPDLLQPRDIGETFRCTACIIEHLSQRRRARSQSYMNELLDAASHTSKDESWIAAKLDLVSVAWKDEDVEEFQSLSSRGRSCTAPWIDPEFLDIVEIAGKEKTSFGSGSQHGWSASRSTFGEMSSPPSPTPTIESVGSSSRHSRSSSAATFSSPFRAGTWQ